MKIICILYVVSLIKCILDIPTVHIGVLACILCIGPINAAYYNNFEDKPTSMLPDVGVYACVDKNVFLFYCKHHHIRLVYGYSRTKRGILSYTNCKLGTRK